MHRTFAAAVNFQLVFAKMIRCHPKYECRTHSVPRYFSWVAFRFEGFAFITTKGCTYSRHCHPTALYWI
jgi:hypothetical protein